MELLLDSQVSHLPLQAKRHTQRSFLAASFKHLREARRLTKQPDASRWQQLRVVGLHVFYRHLNQLLNVFDANYSATLPRLRTAENTWPFFVPQNHKRICQICLEVTIRAKQAVRYPLPEPTSRADAPAESLSLKSSKACACCKVKPKKTTNKWEYFTRLSAEI